VNPRNAVERLLWGAVLLLSRLTGRPRESRQPRPSPTVTPPDVVTAPEVGVPPGPPPVPPAEKGDALSVVEAKKKAVDWRTRLLELELEAQRPR
jgi:hypothetical protein